MLDTGAQIELLRLARTTLEAFLEDGTIPDYRTTRQGLLAPSGAFVSLHKGEELRGCIGQLQANAELYAVVQNCAVSAAEHDRRFQPVTANELAELTIEISVLTPFQPVRNVDEIEVGRHGLVIVSGENRGVFLPQVATEQRWDRETFLNQACRKALLEESAWHDPGTQIYVFEAQVFAE